MVAPIKKSVLIIGATGALGLQLLRHLSDESNITEVHVMARNPDKLASSDQELTTSIQKGDARSSDDIEKALSVTGANYVILSTGNGHSLAKSDTRQATGLALATVLKQSEFANVQVVVMSSTGAGESKVISSWGYGTLLKIILRHILDDHTKQEAEFNAHKSLKKRTLVVRPTNLSDDKPAKSLDFIYEFDGQKKAPSMIIDRSDVAAWVTREIATKNMVGGRKICLTNA